jgi:hypothetical protein
MSSTASLRLPTKRELIADLKAVIKTHGESKITRNFYRQNGKFKEAHWEKFFTNFTKFLEAAGYTEAKPEKPAKPLPPETIEVQGDKMNFSLVSRIQSLDDLVKHFKVDTSVWEAKSFVANAWEMGYTDRSKSAHQIPLYQVKATFYKRKNVADAIGEIASLKEDAKRNAREPKPVVRSITRSGNMLEINIPDAHFGKLAWGVETRGENYDTKIAEMVFMRALETLLERVKGYHFDQVLFVVGNDLFNSDDVEGRTTKGTNVTTDGRYHKTFYVVRRTITRCIERLREIAPVKVMMISGNHDDLSVWHLGDSLECYFAKYADVEIENTPTHYKYHQHGKVMLMMTHGDKGKRTEYPQLMAREQPEMWGSTLFRECHTGHTHMTKLDEKYGVRVRVLPALCPADDWHSENGYIGNLRNAEAYVWNKDEGLVNIAFYNDDSQPQYVTKRELAIAA